MEEREVEWTGRAVKEEVRGARESGGGEREREREKKGNKEE